MISTVALHDIHSSMCKKVSKNEEVMSLKLLFKEEAKPNTD